MVAAVVAALGAAVWALGDPSPNPGGLGALPGAGGGYRAADGARR